MHEAGAGFVVREHGRHPRLAGQARLAGQGEWQEHGRVETGLVREQAIEVEDRLGMAPWRRVELAPDAPTEAGEATIRVWSNPPEEVGADRIAELYRTRWRVGGLFGRLESVLHSELRSLGHPRAALPGFAVAVLAYDVLALLARCVERAHQHHRRQRGQTPHAGPPPGASTYHLALQVRGSYEGLLIAVPPECRAPWHEADPARLAERLLSLARHIDPRQVATSKRKPKPKPTTPKGYVDGKTARAHVATARVLAQARTRP